jgi:predicted Zn-dependent protease
LLTDQRGDAASLKRAKELALRFETSSQPAFMDTLGWVYYKTGEVDKAVDLLKKVAKQAPNVPIFQYHLGMAYHKQGNLSEAKIQLTKAMESKNDFTGKDEARTTLQKIP